MKVYGEFGEEGFEPRSRWCWVVISIAARKESRPGLVASDDARDGASSPPRQDCANDKSDAMINNPNVGRHGIS